MEKKYLLYLISYILYLLNSHAVAAQPLMRDVFAAMPDSVLPMVTKNNRLDCIDFIENNMEAKVRNVADEYVTLEALTQDYARFRTSAAAVMEMKLLPVDSVFLLCLVTTAQAGEVGTPRYMEDSNVRFLRPDWSPLDSVYAGQVRVTLPPLSDFLTKDTSENSETYQQALRSLSDFHPVRLCLSPDDLTLTATLQTAYLAIDERKALTPHLQTLTFTWDGTAFVR